MAKLTLTGLSTLVKAYVDSALTRISADDYTVDQETYSGLLVKIGKQIMQDSTFTDRLSELDGEDLPLGTTIEEYFINLLVPTAWDGTGANALTPDDPVFEKAFYSKELGRKTFTQTLRDNVFEKAMISNENASAIASQIIKAWTDSRTLFKYNAKRQLLGNVIDQVNTAVTANANLTMVQEHAKPVNVATAESFIKLVKERITELSQFVTESNNMGAVPSRAESLVLYVKGSDILPVLDVDALAGAFHKDKVEIPVIIKQVEDFGDTTDTNTYAILMDTRTARLHSHRLNVESQRNSNGEFTNLFAHETYIQYISNFTNINIFKPSGN